MQNIIKKNPKHLKNIFFLKEIIKNYFYKKFTQYVFSKLKKTIFFFENQKMAFKNNYHTRV